MSLRVYRIDDSLFGKLVRKLKTPPLPVAGAVFGVPVLGDPGKNIADYFRGNFFVLSDQDDIARFEDPRGNDLVPDVYYVRHPKKLRTNWLIPAHDFHAFVVREQMGEIVSFLRAELPVKRIELGISEGASLEASANGEVPTQGGPIPVEGSAKASAKTSAKLIVEARKPLKPSEKRREYAWIEDFPNVQAAVDGFEDGSLSFEERSDVSFGVSAKIADVLGVSADYRGDQVWSLTVECF